MYLKFLLIYSYLILNYAECFVSTRTRPNFTSGFGARYRTPTFKSRGSSRLSRSNFGIIKPIVDKPINSFTGNIAVNAPLKPVTTWPNAKTYSNEPPRPSVWNSVPAPKPVVQNDLPYPKQPAYNPHLNFVSPGTPSRSEVQNDRPYVKQQPYNPNFNVTPKPVIQSRWPPYSPHYNTTPKPVVQDDWLYTKQPAYNPYFKVSSTSTPANRNLGPNQPQPNYNPHLKELSEQTMQNNRSTKPPSSTSQNNFSNPKQSAYNPHIEVPSTPTPANRNLASNPLQPAYNSHFKKVSGPTTLNQSTMQRQPRQNPLMPETTTIKSHVISSISTLYPHMTTAQQSKTDHGKNVASKFAGVLGALYTFVKKLTKNHHSTNVEQTFENPILLSPEDSEDKFPVMDLINSYSTKDSNSFSLKESLQKGLLSNKLPAVHRHNLKTKQIYKGKPYILVATVVSSVVAMTALTGGIIFCTKKKSESK